MRPSESKMPLWVGQGVAPPIRPVLPPWGTMAMPLSKQSFTTLATSSVLAGRTTTAAEPTSEPRQSVTKGCLPWSSRIRPLSPTMARRASRTAGVTGTVGMVGMAVSGMVSVFSLAGKSSAGGRFRHPLRRGADGR